MSITPTPHLFNAISLTDLAKPAPRNSTRVYADNSGAPAAKRADPGAKPKFDIDSKPEDKSGRTKLSTSSTTSKDAYEGSSEGPAVAADYRREAVGPSRPQFQKLGQVVDLSV